VIRLLESKPLILTKLSRDWQGSFSSPVVASLPLILDDWTRSSNRDALNSFTGDFLGAIPILSAPATIVVCESSCERRLGCDQGRARNLSNCDNSVG